MCGFIGSVAFDGRRAPEVPDRVASRIKWRGPDRYRHGVSDSHCLGSARLAVIDLDPEADQPLTTSDGAWELVFNGEVYNYRELADSYGLSERARRSDTWVVLELIAKVGVEKARRLLRGMYAFAAWESASQRLWLARDVFGVKPLMWTQTGGAVLFGSDPRSLALWRGALDENCDLDPYALTHYLMLGYIPGDATAWEAIHRLAPGSSLAIDAGGAIVREWDPLQERDGSETLDADRVEEGLMDSLEKHLVADVEVGAFLSGGIDSGLIVAMTRQLFDAPMRTYSVGFDSPQVHDESTAAAGMARRFGSRHVTMRLGSSDFQRLATGVADAFPEPAGDAAAMPMLALSSRAREDVKVVLTGEGGDEMFGGYRRYWALPLARLPMARFAGAIGLGQVAQTLGGRRLRQVAESATAEHGEAYLSYLSPTRWDALLPVAPMATPAYVARAFSRYAVNSGQRPSAKSIRNLELHRHLPESYLEKTDRTTMRHGLEARVPFLDLQLAPVAMSLTDRQLARRGRTKLLLRSLAARHLPSEVAAGPKRGFSVPLSAWMAPDRNAGWIRESMLGGEATQMGLLDQRVLSQTLDTMGNFATDAAADLAYRLLALELWCRSCRADQAS